MGLGHFLSGVKDAAVNATKATAWVVDPRHTDDILRGVGAAGGYVAEHPGKVWDTGFEVGRSIVKDQLKPQNLAITAGLLALTAATGGAAAPALVGEVAEGALVGTEAVGAGAKAVTAGASAVKAAEAAGEVAKGAEAVGTAAKGAQAAGETAQLGRIGRFAQDVRGTASGIQEAEGLTKVDRALNSVTEVRGAAREAVGLSRYGGVAAKRAELAESVASKGGLLGKTSGFIAGSNNSAVEAENVYSNVAKMRTRYNQVQHLIDTPSRITEGAKSFNRKVEVAADPAAAVADAVNQEAERRGIGRAAAYTDTSAHVGDTAERGGGMPRQPQRGAEQQGDDSERIADAVATRIGGGSVSRQRMWEGPGRQWAGGISSNYDWRHVEPLRPISVASRSQVADYRASKRKPKGEATEEGPTNGVVANDDAFSPEAPKFALTAGARPFGEIGPSTFKALGSGPELHFGPAAGRAPGEQNAGTDSGDVMPGRFRTSESPDQWENTRSNAIDTTSREWGSPGTGSWGTVDTGASSSVGGAGPMYAMGTRAQRRRAGQSITGMNPSFKPDYGDTLGI